MSPYDCYESCCFFCFSSSSCFHFCADHSTVAGNGTYEGYSGDGGPATQAQLAWPNGIAMDNMGNLFIADMDNNIIRKVDATGIITTYAGIPGVYGYSGDGGPATANCLKTIHNCT